MKFFERKFRPNSASFLEGQTSTPAVVDDGLCAGENHQVSGEPALSASTEQPIEENMPVADENDEILEGFSEGIVAEKPVMKKSVSMLSFASSDKDVEEELASASEFDRSGRRKTKMVWWVGGGLFWLYECGYSNFSMPSCDKY